MTHLEPEQRVDRLRELVADAFRAGVVDGIRVERTDLTTVLDALDRARDMRDGYSADVAEQSANRTVLDLALDDMARGLQNSADVAMRQHGEHCELAVGYRMALDALRAARGEYA